MPFSTVRNRTVVNNLSAMTERRRADVIGLRLIGLAGGLGPALARPANRS